jgi:predicted DNA-binding protein
MPTLKKRISIVVNEKTYEILRQMSSDKEKSLSKTSLDLIEKALEDQEDAYFSRVVDKRLSQKFKKISHEKAWD